ncbi:MAG: hypothetical protein AAGF01_20150 [Cyanobacteria bacterium P01_G01_bin.38]
MAAVAIAFILCFALGLLVAISGGIIGMVDAFQVSAVWGLLYLFVPFASLVFVVKFWSRKWARNSFLMAIGGSAIAVISSVLVSLSLPTLLEQADVASTDTYGAPAEVYSDAILQGRGSANAAEPSSALEASSQPEPTPAKVGAEATFRDGVNFAMEAAQLTQTASTKADWTAVATAWQQSIDRMKAVPSTDPNYETAQTKVVEYGQNLTYAQQNAL